MSNKHNYSSYTISVDSLVNAISGDKPEKLSLYKDAGDYFRHAPANKKNWLS